MFPLEQHTIFLTLGGSYAHGTARDGSDVDLRGVCVAPLSLRLSLFRTFEQWEGELPAALAEAVAPRLEAHPTASRTVDARTECVVFDVAKFVRLCAAANPNALEILFADERDWLVGTPAWRRLHGERRQFLTKRVQQTFQGYAMAQLRRIETHRSWLVSPPAKKPSREDFGLPIASDGRPGSAGPARDAETQYEAAMKRWGAYQAWRAHRNPARAELERQHGYDTKHAMHLVCILRMGLEALETGELRVRREDAAELAAIRDGSLSLDQLRRHVDSLRPRMDAAARASSLPDDIDRDQVDRLVSSIMTRADALRGPFGADPARGPTA